VSALSGGEDIPNGDEVCHLICEQGCGSQWTDPTGYFLAAEVSGRKHRGERGGTGAGASVELPS
jgi:choline dehydrogenase-like flavoprotein